MKQLSLLFSDWPKVLAAIGAETLLEASARRFGALTRTRAITSGADLLRLILVWSVCGLSLRQTTAWAQLQDVADLSDTALHKRFRGAGDWLQSLVGEQLAKKLPSPPCLPAGYHLRIVDASCISQPGSKGTDWRVHLGLALGSLTIDHLELTTAKGGETLCRFPTQAGDLVLGDRGYSHRAGLAAVRDADGDFLVRMNAHNLPLENQDGTPFELQAAWQTVANTGVFAVVLRSPTGDGWPARVVIQRLPEAKAERARARLLKEARKKSRTVQPKTLEAAGYVLLITSADRLTADEALALYQYRWQVELVFKRLKSLWHLDALPVKDPGAARTWLYAKLLAALVLDSFVHRPVAFSPSGQSRTTPRRVPLATPTLARRRHSPGHSGYSAFRPDRHTNEAITAPALGSP